MKELHELIKRLEVEINKTSTGELRNLLCDVNIMLQQQVLNTINTTLRFYPIEEDSVKELVIDYYAIKWLNANWYYKNGKINEKYGTAPVLKAVKWAKTQLNTMNAKLLLNLLEKRVS